jgi:hypothetical protein
MSETSRNRVSVPRGTHSVDFVDFMDLAVHAVHVVHQSNSRIGQFEL